MPGFDSEQSQKSTALGERPAWKLREAASKIPPPPGVKDIPAPKPVKKIPDIQEDPVLGEMVKYYEANIAGILPASFEILKEIRDDPEIPDTWFKMAVDEAVKANKRRMNYIKGILKRWKVDGPSSNGNGFAGVVAGQETGWDKLNTEED
jgi:DnaD/phage-associated family protein